MPPSLSKYQLSPVLCPYCYCSLLCPWSSEQCLETQLHLYSLDTKYIFVELMGVCGSILSLLYLIGNAVLVPQTNLPKTPSYTEGETLKAKSEGFQEDPMEPWNFQWKLVNSFHATTHLGEKAFKRLLESSFRGTGLQMTIGQEVFSCPTCQ